jgi:protein-L-isoaspartate(D-aspartate) O-methyltransferase
MIILRVWPLKVVRRRDANGPGAGTRYHSACLCEANPGSGADNLSSFANVRVVTGNGAAVPFEAADVIYANAGVTRSADLWLDKLTDGGRLILPLTTNKGFLANDFANIQSRGAMFRIERRRTEFLAQWITLVAIIPCDGVRDETSEAALAEAFKKGGWERVTRLHRNGDVPEDRCWLRAPRWCLAWD